MEIHLNEFEARALGALIEKESSTPEYYPLTLKALTSACNQKSNRHPVMSLQETDVVRALDGLRRQDLAWETYVAGSRVPKYEHKVTRKWNLHPQERALLCLLLLRGPQTVGELRARTGSLFQFDDLEEVEKTLASLSQHSNGPFVMELERMPGLKGTRFVHLLCGPPDLEQLKGELAPEPATIQVRVESERIEALEEAVRNLEERLEELNCQFDKFKAQFE